MEAIELLELIGRGEDSRTQFKRSQDVTNAKSLAGEMVAFANFKGGKILIGVDDNGLIMGLSPEDIHRINQLISNTASGCVNPPINPETENVSIDNKLVMVVTVPEGVSKPYSDNDGVFWVKSGADKRRVTSREELQRMFQGADLIHADEVPVEGTTSSDIDEDHFSGFFKKHYGETIENILERDGLSFGQLLNNFGLARSTTINLAGLMVFGRHP